MISLTIDGREVEVEPGTLILNAAKQAGVEVPVFCYHPRLSQVGACRMCLVHVEKMPKLVPACTTPVAEGMVVRTDTADVRQSHEGVLEFLLGTHPLDCPVCDAGGECELQDNAMRYAPNETRFAEPKRHFKKAWELGPMVELDQERCILCLRCIRFMSDVAGDPALTLHHRGGHTVVDVAEDRQFDSIFAGNTIQICPVGALTSRSYRFKARPWDLNEVDSTCPHCPVGCQVGLSMRQGDLLRVQARDSEAVNWTWLCDRGRFGYGFVQQGPRLQTPQVREGGELRRATWDEALARLAAGLQGRSGALGGGRASLEAQYLMRRWLNEKVGTENVDHRVLPLTAAIAPGPVGRIADIDQADLVLLLDAELLQEAPVVHLRLRHFATQGLRLVSISPRRGLTDLPHEEVRTPDVAAALERLAAGEGDLGKEFLQAERVLLLWSGRGRAVARAIESAALRRQKPTYTMVVGGLANSYGAEAAGLVPGEGCLDTAGMLRSAARGELDALFVLDQDVLDFPDQDLLESALDRLPFLAVASSLPGELARRADVVLPLAAWSEACGHLVNMEGRAQVCYAAAPRQGEAWEDWRVFATLLGVEGDRHAILAEVRRELPELFGPERRYGGRPPHGGPEPDGQVMIGPSIFQKGWLPDPSLRAIVPSPAVQAAGAGNRRSQTAPEDEVGAGNERPKVVNSPDLPAGHAMWRIGTPGGAEVCAALVGEPEPAGRGS
jgi:NADH-quinone oxidoreductase subunit G